MNMIRFKRPVLTVLVLLYLNIIMGVSVPALAGVGTSLNVEKIELTEKIRMELLAQYANEAGEKDVQSWIDDVLSASPGGDNDWYVLNLIHEDYVLDGYSDALREYARGEEISHVPVATRLKSGLVLALLGEDGEVVTELLEANTGKQGIMSYVFALHMLNAGAKGESVTPELILEELKQHRLSDGGWAVMGEVSDNDVTAMVLQALGGVGKKLFENGAETVVSGDAYSTDPGELIGPAVKLLSERQNEDGSYSYMGRPNLETTAQVVLALTALGISPFEDERFVKGGISAADAVLGFWNGRDGFIHEYGGEKSPLATLQGLGAVTSIQLFIEERESFYESPVQVPEMPTANYAKIPEKPQPFDRGLNKEDSEAVRGQISEDEVRISDGYSSKINDAGAVSAIPVYKYYATGIILVLFLFTILSNAIHGRNKKHIIFYFCVSTLLILGVWCTNIETSEVFYSKSIDKQESVGRVRCTVRADVLESEGITPVLAFRDDIGISEGETVYELLIELAAEERLLVDGSRTYIRGINNLYEMQWGDLSGWMYYVNGTAPDVGCGDYRLKDGDTVEWVYTRNLGEDYNSDFNYGGDNR